MKEINYSKGSKNILGNIALVQNARGVSFHLYKTTLPRPIFTAFLQYIHESMTKSAFTFALVRTCIFGLAVPDKYLDSKVFLSGSSVLSKYCNHKCKFLLEISKSYIWKRPINVAELPHLCIISISLQKMFHGFYQTK